MSRVSPFPARPLLFACAFLCLALASARAQVVIGEFMAQNVNSAVLDEDGQHSDWLELQNNGPAAVSLNGWYLTDDAGDLHKWRFPVTLPAVSLAPGARLVVWCSSKNRKAAANKLHTNFKLGAGGKYLALIRADGFTVEHAYAPTYPPQFNNSVYGIANNVSQVELLAETASGKAKVAASAADFTASFTGWNSSLAFDTATWQTGQSGFGYDIGASPILIGPLVSASGDVQAMMSGVNASCFVRYTVNVANPAAVTSLVLKMKYDDGYIAYLNGTKIASSLAPFSPAWNSTATTDRADGAAVNFETASLVANAQNLLVAGDNVLAFQMLNSAAGNDTALLRPQLLANVVTSTATGYLASPTPNAANAALITNFGPAISKVTDQPGLLTPPVPPAANGVLTITAKVIPTLRPLAASSPVTLKFRVMYNSELSVPMYDDGPAGGHGDLIAGDTIFTGQITYASAVQAAPPQPAAILTAGQMLRWRIEAKDTTSIYSYEPAYLFSVTTPPPNPPPVADSVDIDQYFGTIAQNPAVSTSLLPVLHWFTNDAANTRTTTGASCSFFYLNRFYDNVRAELHGQSSSGFPVNKKSHNVNFTKINRFKWQIGQPQVRSMNLLTNYADKSKTRTPLAWEAWSLSGHIMSHWYQTVRVEQNAAFWGVYDMVEDGNEDMLQRFGYNPYDALYKVYDTMSSTANAEQKTREDLDPSKSDYQTMLNGLDPAQAVIQRRFYAYDNVDVSAIVNAQAMHALINNNDWGHKNFYMFRNTTGTGEWSLLPWDQDLSSGHTWVSGPAYFDDEIESQRGIQNGALNRLRQLVYDSPELNKMFVRRMRTLMDEFFVSGTSPTGWYETRIPQMLDLIDPTNLGAGVKSDQQLDFEKWGFWTQGNSAPQPYTTFGAANHTARVQAARLITSNPVPPQTGYVSGSPLGSNTTWPFATGRRRYLYNLDAQNPGSGGVAIPVAQPAVPAGLTIEAVDYNPASGNVNEEYFIIKNQSGAEVDVSGWRITGAGGVTANAVDYVFRGGTVIPNFTSGSLYTATTDVHTGRLHVTRNPAAFRLRSATPKGGQYRLITGPYNGRLSARGGTIELRNKANALVASNTWAASPTASQNFLRVTELNYAPAAPTAAELLALPGVTAGDFEFIELLNTGGAALTLTGAQFDKGVTFTFPTFTLAAGARCLVVANLAAFQLRYGSGMNIAGEFEGSLDNAGETLRLLDSAGEEVLQFTYTGSWYAPTAGAGYSLVARLAAPAFDGYDSPTAWAISGSLGGSPAAADLAGFSQTYEGWRYDYFTTAELGSALAYLTADSDGDGDNNLYEYAYGGDPRSPNAHYAATAIVANDAGTDYTAIQFARRKKALDLTFVIEANGDLTNPTGWTPVNFPVGSPTDLGNGLERVTYRDSQPLSAVPRYLRVRATK